jgi:hypothetical protein
MIFKAEVKWFEEKMHYDTGLVTAESYIGAMKKVVNYYSDSLVEVTLKDVAEDVVMFTDDTPEGAECVNNLVEKWEMK